MPDANWSDIKAARAPHFLEALRSGIGFISPQTHMPRTKQAPEQKTELAASRKYHAGCPAGRVRLFLAHPHPFPPKALRHLKAFDLLLHPRSEAPAMSQRGVAVPVICFLQYFAARVAWGAALHQPVPLFS